MKVKEQIKKDVNFNVDYKWNLVRIGNVGSR